MRMFLVLALAALSINTFAECKEIKVCWEPYDPFQMKSGDKMVGLDFEIMEAVAKKMDCKVKYEEVPWKRCLAGIEAGLYDVAGSASKNAEREKFAHFSNSYISTANAYFTTKENLAKFKIEKMSDILTQKDFKLATVREYDYGAEFQALMKNPAFAAMTEQSDSEEQNFKKMTAGRVQGTYSNEFVGIATLKKLGLLDKIQVTSHKLPSDDSFYMFSKKTRDEKFMSDFNSKLDEIKKDGSLNKIIQSYLK